MTLTPKTSLAFGDSFVLIPYLIKQIEEAYRQYMELQTLIGQGKVSQEYLRFVNSGLDDIVGLIRTLPIHDEKILEEIRTLQEGVNKISHIYGAIPISGEAPMQSLHDQSIAESFEMTNSAKEYASGQEANAVQAFELANHMSPKGAERLSAATSAQILHTLTQLLKINGQILKIQSEQFAMTNMQSKDSVGTFNRVNDDVKKSLVGFSGDLSLPKF